MKGTIISRDKALKRISSGEWDALKNLYVIKSIGKMEIIHIAGLSLGGIINDCNNPKVIFIEITKEE